MAITLDPERKPLNILYKWLNAYIILKLKDGLEYKGRMVQCDNYMNIVLKKASEHFNGELIANYGELFIRGSNISYIILESSHKRTSPKKAE